MKSMQKKIGGVLIASGIVFFFVALSVFSYEGMTESKEEAAALFAIFLILGAASAVTGVTFIVKANKRMNQIEDMRFNGERISAEISEVYPLKHITVNGRHPFKIRCVQSYMYEQRQFESDMIFFDPIPYIKGGAIDVLIDRYNRDIYYVDIDYILDAKKAGGK